METALSVLPETFSLTRPLTSTQERQLTLTNDGLTSLAFRLTVGSVPDATSRVLPGRYTFQPRDGRIPPGRGVIVDVTVQGLSEEPPVGVLCTEVLHIETVNIGRENELAALVQQGRKPPTLRQELPIIYLDGTDDDQDISWIWRAINEEQQDHSTSNTSLAPILAQVPASPSNLPSPRTVTDGEASSPAKRAPPPPLPLDKTEPEEFDFPSSVSMVSAAESTTSEQFISDLFAPVSVPPLVIPVSPVPPNVTTKPTPESHTAIRTPSSSQGLDPYGASTNLSKHSVERWREELVTVKEGEEGDPVLFSLDPDPDYVPTHESPALLPTDAAFAASEARRLQLEAEVEHLRNLILADPAHKPKPGSLPQGLTTSRSDFSHVRRPSDVSVPGTPTGSSSTVRPPGHARNRSKTEGSRPGTATAAPAMPDDGATIVTGITGTSESSGIRGVGWLGGKAIKAIGGAFLNSLLPAEVRLRMNQLRNLVKDLENHVQSRGDVVLGCYYLYARPQLLSRGAAGLPVWKDVRPLRVECERMQEDVKNVRRKAEVIEYAEFQHGEKDKLEAYALDGRIKRVSICLEGLVKLCNEMKEGKVYIPRPFIFDLIGIAYLFQRDTVTEERPNWPTDEMQNERYPLRYRAAIGYQTARENLSTTAPSPSLYPASETGSEQPDWSLDALARFWEHAERERVYVEAVALHIEAKMKGVRAHGPRPSSTGRPRTPGSAGRGSLDSTANRNVNTDEEALPYDVRHYFDVRGRFGDEHVWHLNALCEPALLGTRPSSSEARSSRKGSTSTASDAVFRREASGPGPSQGGRGPAPSSLFDTLGLPPVTPAIMQSIQGETIKLRLTPRSVKALVEGATPQGLISEWSAFGGM